MASMYKVWVGERICTLWTSPFFEIRPKQTMLIADNATFVNRSGTISFQAAVSIAENLSIEITIAPDAKLQERFRLQDKQSVQTGTLTDECYFYAAFAISGQQIQANDILLATMPESTENGMVFHAVVDLLTYGDQPPSDLLELDLNVDFEVMQNGLGILGERFDSVEFGQIEILPGVGNDRCTLRSQLKTAIPYPENRIVEVLRCLTGIDISWIEARVAGKRMVRAPRTPLFLDPALSIMPQGDRASAIKLFDALARFVGTNTGKFSSSETDTLSNLRQSQSQLVNYRLILGAAVEHLLKRFPGGIAIGQDFLEQIDESLFIVEGAGFKPAMKEKLKSALVNQRNLQPKLVLAAMKAQGLVESTHIKTYENIRNMGSQGEPSSLKEVNDTKRKTSIVLDLVYRILLNGISYSGKYRSPIKNSDVSFRAVPLA